MRINNLYPEKSRNELEEQEEEDKKKQVQKTNNTLNMIKFEDCDFENATIVFNFEGPD